MREKLKFWWLETAWPGIKEYTVHFLVAWWDDIELHPGLHSFSMIFGGLLLLILQVVV